MAEEIINKVSQSSLVTIYLEDHYPKGERVLVDIKDQLYKGIALKEKDFRAYIKETDWSVYQDKYVALSCSVDAIIPVWAFMLLTSEIEPYAKKVVLGTLADLESNLFQGIVEGIDVSEYQDAKVVIKGCGQLPVPDSAYVAIIEKLQPIASSIMYGEACSTVPLYKRKKK
ncbi:MAG: DUF2480 family protein [Flavobacteriales bacterium]|nr:DUF2480 family protein [Flavobacteriales bacterium]